MRRLNALHAREGAVRPERRNFDVGHPMVIPEAAQRLSGIWAAARVGSRLSASLRPGRPARFQVRVRADDGSYGALRLARTGARTPAISSSNRPLSSQPALIAASGDDT